MEAPRETACTACLYAGGPHMTGIYSPLGLLLPSRLAGREVCCGSTFCARARAFLAREHGHGTRDTTFAAGLREKLRGRRVQVRLVAQLPPAGALLVPRPSLLRPQGVWHVLGVHPAQVLASVPRPNRAGECVRAPNSMVRRVGELLLARRAKTRVAAGARQHFFGWLAFRRLPSTLAVGP